MRKQTNEEGDNHEFLTKCGACGMSLPMAGNTPMAQACLKCYPNGPAKQVAKKDDSDGDADKDPKKKKGKKVVEGYDDKDSDSDSDDEDVDDDEEE